MVKGEITDQKIAKDLGINYFVADVDKKYRSDSI